MNKNMRYFHYKVDVFGLLVTVTIVMNMQT